MSDDQESTKKSGWGQLGHQWITAIAALVTALAGAGFFIGRESAPEPKAASAVTVPAGTVTVTQSAPGEIQATVSKSVPPSPAGNGAGVYFSSEEFEWGEFNLDFNPPRYLAGKYIYPLGRALTVQGEAAKLAEWQTDSVPGKDECTSAVAERGQKYTGDLVASSHVCGKTAEGRVFRFDVIAAGATIRGKVIVWNK
ncbi:hypothetical protein DL991_14985 [Amycolatopsis sp. WAC 01375]|uniref:hypothetical protein n=1 Tax=Amycolatopsis sp. WAC 01375 TaxID=2203194 RepID=UPI000F7A8353|nr:hypothetical protein [Amycolatopsis sp. WAC 01375]RSM79195.1 hypothetical protein DL991_14985 [Amycolatopsis sp. WAC 01375]